MRFLFQAFVKSYGAILSNNADGGCDVLCAVNLSGPARAGADVRTSERINVGNRKTTPERVVLEKSRLKAKASSLSTRKKLLLPCL